MICDVGKPLNKQFTKLPPSRAVICFRNQGKCPVFPGDKQYLKSIKILCDLVDRDCDYHSKGVGSRPVSEISSGP